MRAAIMLICQEARYQNDERKNRFQWDYSKATYLVGFKTLYSLFLLLFAEDDEGASVLVKSQAHVFGVLDFNYNLNSLLF